MRDAFLCVESTTSFAVAGVLLHTTATVSFTCTRSTAQRHVHARHPTPTLHSEDTNTSHAHYIA